MSDIVERLRAAHPYSGIVDQLDLEAAAEIERLGAELEQTNEAHGVLVEECGRLRAALTTAHGALLYIGGTDSNWSKYACNVADEVGRVLDPAAFQQKAETK